MVEPGTVQAAASQYSVPGIVALLIVREVFGFVRSRNGNGKPKITSLLATQTEILKRMNERQEEQGKVLTRIEDRTRQE